ncbi:predicted protein [Naegleria gruberi]|uniref:Predicted protein n=1 Tax=Naegleria gruberi TaxID=5762 RepID=D2V3M1_NAEGR|nr:uncharacterized protein NAEGRDRAFT_78433 [Naegleria gruberi]EFC48795.1 predicted protein [Naegleria gruberi]|eukprot:XP_002681539.1 predicted protein [Naegleria gruberi strain NEG-M]
MQQQQSPRTLVVTSSKSSSNSPPTNNNTSYSNNNNNQYDHQQEEEEEQYGTVMADNNNNMNLTSVTAILDDDKQSSSSLINNNNTSTHNTTTTHSTTITNRRRGQSTHSPSNLLIPLLGSSEHQQQQQQQQSTHAVVGVSSPSSDRRRSVSDGILSSYASNYQPLSNSSNHSNNLPPHSVLPSSNLNIINQQQQQPSSSTSPQNNNIGNTTTTAAGAATLTDDLENNKSNDEWLVVPILIVSSLPKEVDQILRYYTTGKQLKKQSPPCCANEKHSHQQKDEPKKELSDTNIMNIIITGDNSLDEMSPMNDSSSGGASNHKKESENIESDDDENVIHKEHGPNHQRPKHHRSSNSGGASKHHHHKSSSGSLSVSFQVPNGSESSRRKASTEDSSQGNIQNIQEHIHQQLVLHENQEVKISVAAPPPSGNNTHKQSTTNILSSSAKKSSSSSSNLKSTEKSPHKLNYYLRKNKRVTEWYIEEVCSLDYLNHVDEFLEKNEVNQISSLANDLLNTGINLEDLISIDEEEFFESVLEKQNRTSTNERRKIMFRVCHTGSRHALSLRQALYKQMILEETTEGNQTIAPTTVIFAYSYTNSNYSLENTAMTWMKEINQIYPDFLSQGNFLLAGHIELNKSTKQQVALLRRGVEDSSANVGLVQKPKHYYHFHQKAVPLFQMKKNQRLTIVEFDTRLGTNIPQLFFESYRLYCLNYYRKKLSQALKPKQVVIPPIPTVLSGSVSPGHEPSEPQVTSPTLNNMPSQTTDAKQSEEAKKKKETQIDPNEPIPPVNEEEEQTLPKTASPSGASLSSHKPESKPETKSEKTALPLGILKIFKKSKKEESLPSSKKPPVEKILKNLKKKKKKEDEIFRWHKIADNLIMSEKPKKKNKKDKQVGVKDTISATDDNRDVMSDTYFHNRKNMPLFPYSLHLMDQSDTFSPQFERNNSNILSKPIEDDENPYLEDPTENDLMGEASESSSVPDTFEHNFTAVTNTNSSYPGEVIASDNEEADLDTENDIGSEVDDFTFQSSIGSATPQVLNATIFEKHNNLSVLDRNSKDACWEELDQGEDMISVGDIS